MPDLGTKKYKSEFLKGVCRRSGGIKNPTSLLGLHLDKEASPSVLANTGKLCSMEKPDCQPSRLHFAAGMEQLRMSAAEETDGERRVDR